MNLARAKVCHTVAVFTIQATRKLLDRVKAPVAEPVTPTALLGNWHATALMWRPQQMALLVNDATRLPVFVPLAPARTLHERINDAVGQLLEALGVSIDIVIQEAAEMAQVSYAKTSNRSVIGSMNEFAHHGKMLHEQGWDPLAISVELANTICGPLMPADYTPNDALDGLLLAHFADSRRSRTSGKPPSSSDLSTSTESTARAAAADLSEIDMAAFMAQPLDSSDAPQLADLAHIQSLVYAGTSRPGRRWHTALPCRFVAAGECTGHILVQRMHYPTIINWRCSQCDEAGSVSNWEATGYDLTPAVSEPKQVHDVSDVLGGIAEPAEFSITLEQPMFDVLRQVVALDPEVLRLVFGARSTTHGVEVAGRRSDLEVLVSAVAGEARAAASAENPDPTTPVDVLDELFDLLEDLLR